MTYLEEKETQAVLDSVAGMTRTGRFETKPCC